MVDPILYFWDCLDLPERSAWTLLYLAYDNSEECVSRQSYDAIFSLAAPTWAEERQALWEKSVGMDFCPDPVLPEPFLGYVPQCPSVAALSAAIASGALVPLPPPCRQKTGFR